jgi:hypothetical protein
MVRTIAINITMVYAWLCARSSQIHDLLLAELLKTRFVHILLYLVRCIRHAYSRTTKKNNVTEGRSV